VTTGLYAAGIGAGAVGSSGAADPFAGWIWPVPIHPDGRRPKISQGYDAAPDVSGRFSARHAGVDIMYPRRPEEPIGLPYGTRGHFMPDGIPALAAGPGKVYSSKMSSLGWSVVIDHGQWATFYQHMRGPLVQKGQLVVAGTPLAEVHHSPAGYGLKHLHFELWHGASTRHVDPAPFMLGGHGGTPWRMVGFKVKEGGGFSVGGF